MTARGEAFSGHESFPCRYGWLPKLHEAVTDDPRVFADDEGAMVTLGLGKNMVRSIRFWGDAFGLVETSGREVMATDLARRLLDPVDGRDPHLEDLGSLWRLHWVLASRANLGAWNVALRHVHDAEVTRSRLVELVHARALEARPGATHATSVAHVDMFLRTYDGSRPSASGVVEDTLASPFQELGLLEVAELGGTQMVRFEGGPKPGLDASVMAFALRDHWAATSAGGRTTTMRSVALDRAGPGATFRLDEATAHALVEDVCAASEGALRTREDGAGGVNLACLRGDPLAVLEGLAWS